MIAVFGEDFEKLEDGIWGGAANSLPRHVIWKTCNPLAVIAIVAEREGFEPSVRLPVRSLSKGVLSTTQPPFREAGREG